MLICICPQVLLFMCPTVLRLTECFFTPKFTTEGTVQSRFWDIEIKVENECKDVSGKGSFP